MEIRDLLRDLKLNKYESIAYEIILKKGVSEASFISKEGGIPFGKIYESLGSLFSKGLIEIQNTRPKKYKIKNPKVAFKNILDKKISESEEELKNLKNSLLQIEEQISMFDVNSVREKTFWVTAIGDEIEEMMRNVFSEAEKEIFMIPYVINKTEQLKLTLVNIHLFLKELDDVVRRKVKIKVLFPEKFAKEHIKTLKKMKVFDKVVKSIEIRILSDLSPEPFSVIDENKVILRVNDPLDGEKVLAMIKVIDSELSRKLKKKFNEMWKSAKAIKLV